MELLPIFERTDSEIHTVFYVFGCVSGMVISMCWFTLIVYNFAPSIVHTGLLNVTFCIVMLPFVCVLTFLTDNNCWVPLCMCVSILHQWSLYDIVGNVCLFVFIAFVPL